MDSANTHESSSSWGRDILIIILILGVGFAGGYLVGQENNEYKNAVNILVPELEEEIFSFGGEILSISGNSLLVETSSLERLLPGQESKLREVRVNTNPETAIIEFDSFVLPENPEEEPFLESEISFSDLAVGDRVSISSSENVKGLTEINAESITRIFQPEIGNSIEEFPEN